MLFLLTCVVMLLSMLYRHVCIQNSFLYTISNGDIFKLKIKT